MLKTNRNIDIERLSEVLERTSDKTPYTNLGGLESQMLPYGNFGDCDIFLENGYKLDWLSFTFCSEKFDFKNVLQNLKYDLEHFEDIPGRYFYNSGLTLGRYVNVYYNSKNKLIHSNSSNTVNVVFTGQGCTDLALKFDNDIYKIFELLHSFDVKVTRIDLAYDDFRKLLDFEEIKQKLNNGHFRSSKKSYNIVKSSNVNGDILGETIYIGSARTKNGYYLRMYDKKAQYEEKNQILPKVVELNNIWQRYEISFTKSKSHEVFLYLLFDKKYKFNVDCLFKETLRNIVEFLDITYTKKGSIQKRERWLVSDWWNNFLMFDNKITFINHERDVDFGRLLSWLTVSIIPNLKLLELIFNNFGYDFYDIIRDYNFSKEFSKKQLRLLNNSKLLSDEQFNNYILEYFKGIKENENI